MYGVWLYPYFGIAEKELWGYFSSLGMLLISFFGALHRVRKEGKDQNWNKRLAKQTYKLFWGHNLSDESVTITYLVSI